jgi:SRSO17 transposase
LRVWPGGGWATGDCAGAEPIWLLIERQADGKLKYAFSNLPADAPRLRAVRLWKSRWPVEQGYQQQKEELGLDHFEGRSWRGFHHHTCLVMLAYGFLVLERLRAQRHPAEPGKKGIPSQVLERLRAQRHPAEPGKKGIPSQRSRCRQSAGHCSDY